MPKDSSPINIAITFRNIDASEALKEAANSKLNHLLGKFVHKDTKVHLVLKVDGDRQMAESTFHHDGKDFHGRGESADMYQSLDKLVDSLRHQLSKHKEMLTSHRA